MIRAGNHLYLAVPLIMALSACASSDGRYPSLAVRDIERFNSAAPVEPDKPSDTKRTEHQKTVTIAINDVVEAHERFLAYKPEAFRLIEASRGLGNESDSRAQALIALAVLRGHHSAAVMARGRLDELIAKETIEYGEPFIADLGQSLVEDRLSHQTATLDSLSETLKQ